MASVNSCTFIGRLGKDPELQVTTEGKPYTKFSLAVDRFKKDAMWLNCTAWDKLAEIVDQYGKKGMLVYVQGQLDVSAYIGKDGVGRVGVSINVKEFQMLERKGDTPQEVTTIVQELEEGPVTA